MIKMTCAGCGRSPEELGEYDPYGDENYESANEVCWENEGTLNVDTGAFLCDQCYIRAGTPTGSKGWTVPEGWVAPWA